MPALRFEISRRAADCSARLGRVTTPHGPFDTPAFMPVGTQAAVKGLLPGLVAQTGAQIILANTYHLLLRPGPELVAKMGGLQRWMNWHRPMLTDSGGYQVFSLADISRITDEGVTFKSHLDGALVDLTPARSIAVQNLLGADIIMALDDCPPSGEGSGFRVQGSGGSGQRPEVRGQDSGDDAVEQELTPEPRTLNPSPKPRTLNPEPCGARVRLACERSARWLEQCIAAHARKDEQALFGIVQGGTDLDQRTWCAGAITQHDLPGFAIGGVAVGEGFELIKAVVEHTAPLLPADKPRYLMGVGYERDMLAAIRAGVDMFDCVLPTRNGRNANAFTPTGQIRLRNAKYADDPRPIDEACDCPACAGFEFRVSGFELGAEAGPGATVPPRLETRNPKLETNAGFSRSYLRHLFMAGEMLGPILVSAHNLRHFQRYLLDIRRAIADNDWSLVQRNWPVAVR